MSFALTFIRRFFGLLAPVPAGLTASQAIVFADACRLVRKAGDLVRTFQRANRYDDLSRMFAGQRARDIRTFSDLPLRGAGRLGLDLEPKPMTPSDAARILAGRRRKP